ncbi:MAG: hypothetical protein PUJ09_04635, partial [Eubacteriales bacterium]|nr:hypothetical protein [Eubacteriales bacterium]
MEWYGSFDSPDTPPNCKTKRALALTAKAFLGTLHQKRYFAFFCYREHFLLHKPGVKMMTRGL